jgi:large subunit ribosomal protein L4
LIVNVINQNGVDAGEIDVRDDIFGVPEKSALVHQVMVGQLANKRQGTAKTKNRSEVSGGGAKPRPQKHSGRSRQGSIRSPIWVGGGRAFGPTPRSYRQNTPKKMRRIAMLSVLSDKLRNGSLVIVDELNLENGKTKEMAAVLSSIGIEGSCLVVDDNSNEKVIKGSRNIPRVKTLPAGLINALDLINKKRVLLTIPAVRKIEEIWSGVYRGQTVGFDEEQNEIEVTAE